MMKCIELSNLFNLNFSPESDLRGFFKACIPICTMCGIKESKTRNKNV